MTFEGLQLQGAMKIMEKLTVSKLGLCLPNLAEHYLLLHSCYLVVWSLTQRTSVPRLKHP